MQKEPLLQSPERTMKVVGTVIATLLVLVVIAAIIMFTGVYNVAATDKHTGLVNWVLATTRVNSVRTRAEDIPVPGDLASPDRIAAGAGAYDKMCVACHGAPGVDAMGFADHMMPKPPEMGHVAEFWAPASIYWILDNGFKMTGMPAWGPIEEAEELWDITAFVEAYPDIDAARYQELIARAGGHERGDEGAAAGAE
ncbi:c-type cytochrome [Caenispirillum salinarum]|uniref:c-type cytochrome n=1 Tax=Caenispirillum salinarum TaxID=859058 RepID=UPI00384BE886